MNTGYTSSLKCGEIADVLVGGSLFKFLLQLKKGDFRHMESMKITILLFQ